MFNILRKASDREQENRLYLAEMLQSAPIPRDELWQNMPLFVNRQCLTQMLFMNELYGHILAVPGIICEFGVRFGRNVVMYQNLAGIYEPFNHTRRVVGFDTFAGFPSVHAKDGNEKAIEIGAFAVGDDYERYLMRLLEYHRRENPIPHILRYDLVKGDVMNTLPSWLQGNPATIIALAYFDLDLYEPTLACLNQIIPRLIRGSVLVFDEFNCEHFPGETRAALESVGDLRFQKSRFAAHQSFAIWGESR